MIQSVLLRKTYLKKKKKHEERVQGVVSVHLNHPAQCWPEAWDPKEQFIKVRPGTATTQHRWRRGRHRWSTLMSQSDRDWGQACNKTLPKSASWQQLCKNHCVIFELQISWMNPIVDISETDLFLEIFSHSCGTPQLRQARPDLRFPASPHWGWGGGRAPGSSFGKLPWKAAVVTLAAAVCHLRTFILHPIGRIAEADMVDYHSSAVELTLQSTFFISFLVRLFFYNVPADFYLTLTAVIWVNGKPHHICTATNLLQIEKMYTVPLKISLGLSANMWWGPPGRRKADPSL